MRLECFRHFMYFSAGIMAVTGTTGNDKIKKA
jgi:hypothetical protein